MRLSKYPKKGLSFSQIDDAEKIAKERAKAKIKFTCPCGSKEFMITTLGLEVCSKCFRSTGIFIL